MLSGLLITLDIFVCIALVIVVLLQRSEGGAFGMGGGPTGLITARGAGDLLTRTTWVLFATFIGLSLALSLLAAHDRSSSGLIERLKLQQANPTALGQPAPTLPPSPAAGAAAPPTTAPSGDVTSASDAATAAPPAGAAPPPAAAPRARRHVAHAAPATPSISLEAPNAATTSPTPPPLVAPAPKPDDTGPSAASGSAPAPQP